MASIPCAVPGCAKGAHRTHAGRGFSPFCNAHRIRAKRHGHPEQDGVKQSALKPYRQMIKRRVEKNADNQAWPLAAARWNSLVSLAEDRAGAYDRGKADNTYAVAAAREILKLAPQVSGQDVWQTVAALFLMREFEPRRFKSDDGFVFEVVRIVRNLGHVACGTTYVPTKGRTRPVYRDPSPETVRILGSILVEAFGALGLHLAKHERKEQCREQDQKRELWAALEAVE